MVAVSNKDDRSRVVVHQERGLLFPVAHMFSAMSTFYFSETFTSFCWLFFVLVFCLFKQWESTHYDWFLASLCLSLVYVDKGIISHHLKMVLFVYSSILGSVDAVQKSLNGYYSLLYPCIQMASFSILCVPRETSEAKLYSQRHFSHLFWISMSLSLVF